MKTTDIKSTFYKINIHCTGKNSMREEKSYYIENVKEYCINENDIKKYLISRYGKMPSKRKKAFIDRNGITRQIGFVHSYWNWNCSHNSKKWFQTDWIEISKVEEIMVLL